MSRQSKENTSTFYLTTEKIIVGLRILEDADESLLKERNVHLPHREIHGNQRDSWQDRDFQTIQILHSSLPNVKQTQTKEHVLASQHS